ncbi:SpdA protein [Streptomyces malaysiensis]|uniref:SpdA protein n=1 Tax=Streptomyces malaysiensis TaxID=92644 RepID=UPI0018D5158B|nr:SpdA protein [Streptomyces sp. M56]
MTLIMAAVVGLTFLFGFGNVWTLALRLGVPPWVAPLVAPAVDLSVLGLLLGTRFLALQGASREQLRPARRLLLFSSLMTLALNVADPLLAGQNGKAAFDAVGPLLLIGWAEVGPGLLQAISALEREKSPDPQGAQECSVEHAEAMITPESINIDQKRTNVLSSGEVDPRAQYGSDGEDLLERALAEDAWHWETYQRPISAETLRKRLRVGAARSRMLVAVVRSTRTGHLTIKETRPQPGPDCADGAGEECPTHT